MSDKRPETQAAQRILAVTEEELQRMVLDIHDGPVQQLFAAQSQLTLAQKRRAKGDELSKAELDLLLTRLNALLGGALGEIRSFLGAFRPPDFVSRDLAQILQGLVMHHELTTGCEAEFVVDKRPFTPPLPVKICLYRICQEALSNAYQHAAAKRQTICLRHEQDEIVLTIRDDGKGFTPPPLDGPDATERAEHIGLRGMRDRVALVGGSFSLSSVLGEGVRIEVRISDDG